MMMRRSRRRRMIRRRRSNGSSLGEGEDKEGYTALTRTLTQHNQELGITLADAFIRWARHLPTLEAQPPLLEYIH